MSAPNETRDDWKFDVASRLAETVYLKRQSLREFFAKADAGRSGKLTHDNFKSALTEWGVTVGLTEAELDALAVDVDADGDGFIEWDEFVARFDLHTGSVGKGGARAARLQELAQVLYDQRGPVMKSFKEADTKGEGVLDYQTFCAALVSLQAGVTYAEAEELARHADKNGDGHVNFSEYAASFVVKDTRRLLKFSVGGCAAEEVCESVYRKRDHMLGLLYSADEAATGLLPLATMRELLEPLGKGLTPQTWAALCSTIKAFAIAQDAHDDSAPLGSAKTPRAAYSPVKVDDSTGVDYAGWVGSFVPVSVGLPHGGRSAALRLVAHALYANRLRLTDFFRQLDKDRNGTVTLSEFRTTLVKMRLGIPLKDIDELFAVGDTSGAGKLSYDEFLTRFFIVDKRKVAREQSQEGTAASGAADARAQEATEMSEDRAATLIASGYRGMMARKQCREKREEARAAREEAEAAAAAVITRHAQGYIARRRVAETRAAERSCKEVDRECLVVAARARDYMSALGQRLGSLSDGRSKERPSSSRKGAEALRVLAPAAAIRNHWGPEETFDFIASTTKLVQYADCFKLNLVTGKRLCKLRMMHLTRLGIQLHDHQRIVMVAIHEAQNVASQTAILEAIDAAGEDDAAPYLSLVTWEDEA